MIKCKTCAFMCKKEGVKSCPTHKYSGIYVNTLEQQNTKLLEVVKELSAMGDKEYYEACDFHEDTYGVIEKAQQILAEVRG